MMPYLELPLSWLFPLYIILGLLPLFPSKYNSLTSNFNLPNNSSIHSFLSIFSTCDLIPKLPLFLFLDYCNSLQRGLSIFPLATSPIHFPPWSQINHSNKSNLILAHFAAENGILWLFLISVTSSSPTLPLPLIPPAHTPSLSPSSFLSSKRLCSGAMLSPQSGMFFLLSSLNEILRSVIFSLKKYIFGFQLIVLTSI